MKHFRVVFVTIFSLAVAVKSDMAYDEEIFDDENEPGELPLEKYVAGSTDDLGRLFDLEKGLFGALDEFMIKNANTKLKNEVERIQEFFVKYKIDGALLRSQV